jgi:D-3-phosphoglycerate dehydrogenase
MRLKQIIYLQYLAHPAFAEIFAARPDFRLTRFANDWTSADAEALLTSAHVYQIPATRDDVPPLFRADRNLFAHMPELLVVSSSGAGYDTIDLAACTQAGILAVNQAGGNREAVAEHALAMMLCLSKRIIECDRAMRRAPILDRTALMGHDLAGKTVGIIGLGAVGTRLAQLCRGLFGMRILAFDPYLPPAEFRRHGAESVPLPTLLQHADFCSVHCPFTAETDGMIDTAAFALMPPHAYFISTARGGIHDEVALAEALATRRIAGAGLDVWWPEPPPADHPLLAFDNVIATTHTAGVTHEARKTIATMAAQQIIDLFTGKRTPRILNPDAWPLFSARLARAFDHG